MSSLFKKLQYLSIDIVLGALAIGYLAVRLFNVVPNPVWWVVLALSVWSVYTVDHLLDGIRLRENATIQRHLFHFKYRKVLITLVIAFSVLSLYLSFKFLDKVLISSGVVLGVLTLFYLIFLNLSNVKIRSYIPKEIIIAFIYVSGIFMGPIIWNDQLPNTFQLLVCLIIMLLTFSEGVIISFFDFEKDIADGHSSFTTKLGKSQTRKFLTPIHLIIEVSLIVYLFIAHSRFEIACVILLIIMNFILAVLIIIPHNPHIIRYYRAAGELVFMLPWVLFIF